MEDKRQPHFLVATFPAQGHINPALHLAKRIARTSGARITFSTALHAHLRMFPSSLDHQSNEFFSFIPYSNGLDDSIDPMMHDFSYYMIQCNKQGSSSLSSILDSLAAVGRPVTCIIYSFFMSWAADIARDRGIPSFLYWIQPATVFAVYWHCFHGCKSIITANAGDPWAAVSLPHLPPMRIRDLPSFVATETTEDANDTILRHIWEMFHTLDTELEREGRIPRVLANTAWELEALAIASVADKVELLGIGPVLEDASEGSLFKAAAEEEYMEWLDCQEKGSVVYVSFGSVSVLMKEQMEEIWRGLRKTQRPYLWVIRKDNRWEGIEMQGKTEEKEKAKVVTWCEQGKVLGHRAVGCFVTHCGWNSTVESLLNGVPTVAVPQWTDQTTNAWLMEKEWGTGVRVEAGKEGLLEAEELRSCVEMVMGEGEKGEEIRRKARTWSEKLKEATGEDGSSGGILKAIVKDMVGL